MEIWGFICVCKCCDVRTICCPRICIDGRPLARCPSGVCTWFWGWVLWPSPCSWGTSSCRKKKKKKKKKNIIKSQKLDNKLKTAERPSEAKRPLGAWSILCICVQFTQLLLPKQNKKKKLNNYLFSLPSSLGDDHFRPHFVKLRPEFSVVEENFDAVHPLQREKHKQAGNILS